MAEQPGKKLSYEPSLRASDKRKKMKDIRTKERRSDAQDEFAYPLSSGSQDSDKKKMKDLKSKKNRSDVEDEYAVPLPPESQESKEDADEESLMSLITFRRWANSKKLSTIHKPKLLKDLEIKSPNICDEVTVRRTQSETPTTKLTPTGVFGESSRMLHHRVRPSTSSSSKSSSSKLWSDEQRPSSQGSHRHQSETSFNSDGTTNMTSETYTQETAGGTDQQTYTIEPPTSDEGARVAPVCPIQLKWLLVVGLVILVLLVVSFCTNIYLMIELQKYTPKDQKVANNSHLVFKKA